MKLEYCPTHIMVADILTKPIQRVKFEFLWKSLSMVLFEKNKQSKRGT